MKLKLNNISQLKSHWWLPNTRGLQLPSPSPVCLWCTTTENMDSMYSAQWATVHR